MKNQFAWIERPFANGTGKWLRSSVSPISKDESDSMLNSGGYCDIVSATQAHSRKATGMNPHLDLLFAGKLMIMTARLLRNGGALAVEVDVQDQPEPVKAVAIVVRQLPRQLGMYVFFLRFIGLTTQYNTDTGDAMAVGKPVALPQYLA